MAPSWSVTDRVHGFTRAIQEAGGEMFAEDAVREILAIPGCRSLPRQMPRGLAGTIIYPERAPAVSNAYANGFYHTLRMLDAAALPDSILCANDDGALGVLAACADRGVRVPEDVRVSGHDLTSAGQFAMAPLTTVRVPHRKLAEAAAEGILRAIDEGVSAPSSTQLPGVVVVTRSCGQSDEIRALAEQRFFESGGLYEWKAESSGMQRLEPYEPAAGGTSAPLPTMS